jgi:hypothetical protein
MRRPFSYFVSIFVLLFGYSVVHAQQTDSLATPKGWWVLPGTKTQFKIGGYIKLDMIHDFDPIKSPDFFDVSQIPTDSSLGQSTHLNAKETRLSFDAIQHTGAGKIRAYIEGDFYGSGSVFRLRHAYIEFKDTWFAGQTWSVFMDETIIPNTLDFEKPAAYAFVRHPLIGAKLKLKPSTNLFVALEEPSKNAQAPSTAGQFENHLPDLTMRLRHYHTRGHLQISGFAAQLAYRPLSGDLQKLALYGLNLSGQFMFRKEKEKLSFQVLYGPGAGRYRSGLSAAPDASGDIQALVDLGATLSFEHNWSDQFSSFFIYNTGRVFNTEGQANSALEGVDYAAANLIWKFAPGASTGIEYLWGLRQDKGDASGTANRVQWSVKYVFN